MANNYLSKPVYLNATGTDINGYTCPLSKRAIIKAIVIANETPSSGSVSVLWQDNNSVGVGSSLVVFPVLVSGLVPGFGRLRAIDDFLAIRAGDSIILRTTTSTALNVLFSIVEQDI